MVTVKGLMNALQSSGEQNGLIYGSKRKKSLRAYMAMQGRQEQESSVIVHSVCVCVYTSRSLQPP